MWEAASNINIGDKDKIIRITILRVDGVVAVDNGKRVYNQYYLNMAKCKFINNVRFPGPRDPDVDPFHAFVKDWLRYHGATTEMLNYYDDNIYDGLWPVFFETKTKLIDFYGAIGVRFVNDPYTYAKNITNNGYIVGGKPRAI